LSDVHRDVVAHVREEGHEALQHPRQLSRFLCGLTSPATSRARLSRHARFGCFSELPFSGVLHFVEKV
jgi:ATP-dependent DNA helicase RecQ